MIALTPGGRMLDDALAAELAAEPELTLLCGRYEGFDERIVEHFCSEQVSIGRYVLAGGELAAMVVCDAVLRKLPGALGHEESARRGVLQRGARRALRSTRTTRGRRNGAAGRVPEVLLPAITRASASGGASAHVNGARGEGLATMRPPLREGPPLRGFFFAMSTVIDSSRARRSCAASRSSRPATASGSTSR